MSVWFGGGKPAAASDTLASPGADTEPDVGGAGDGAWGMDAAAVAAEASAEGASEASESEVVDADVGGASALAAAACAEDAASAGASPEAEGGEFLDPWSVGASDDSEDIPIPTL